MPHIRESYSLCFNMIFSEKKFFLMKCSFIGKILINLPFLLGTRHLFSRKTEHFRIVKMVSTTYVFKHRPSTQCVDIMYNVHCTYTECITGKFF